MGNSEPTAWLGTAVGVVLLFSVVCLAIFFAIAGPFGALNDWSIGLGVAAPGVVMGIDDMATAPGWVWIAFIGWLGIFFLYPIWAILLGRVTRQG